MKFIGIDLGWQSGPSGLCCLELVEGSLVLQALERKATFAEVLGWVEAIAPTPTPAIVAIDAPTLIPNETGMRLAERLTHKHFHKYHAGCHPANLGRPFAAGLIQFALDVEAQGFAHAPTITPRQEGRYQIEVFPHPATIQLFGLTQILKYKKGRLAERGVALNRLREHILNDLPQHEPPLVGASLPPIPTSGKAMKAVEDRLDSVLCAYVGAHWWYWGAARNVVMGNYENGYIVIPRPPDAPVQTVSSAVVKDKC